MRHFISEHDRLLLQRQFRVTNPQAKPGLTLRVERGVKAVRIVHWYDETNTVAGNNKPIACAFGHSHGKGFVVELEDGRTVLVGKDCARKDFGFDFDDVVKRFEGEADRQFQIRRLLVVQDRLPAALAELEQLQRSVAVTAFDDYWRAMSRHFGRLSQHLAKVLRSSQGRLMATKMVYSEEATERAAKATAKKLVEHACEPSLFERIAAAATDSERERAERQWYSFVATHPKKYVPTPLDLGLCEGWTLIRASDRSTPAKRIEEAKVLARDLSLNRPTDLWSRRDFAKLKRSLDAMFAALDDAARLVDDLLRFASAENIRRIAAWAQQVESTDNSIGHRVNADGRALIGRSRLELPEDYRWLQTPQLDALRLARAWSGDLDLAA